MSLGPKLSRHHVGRIFAQRLGRGPSEDGDRSGELARLLVQEYEEQGNGWFWQSDADGCVTYLSAKVAREVQAGSAEAAGVPLTHLFQSRDTDRSGSRTLAFYLSSKTGFSDLPVRSGTGGEERWWSISGRPMIDPLGHVLGFVGIGSDLTEQRRSENEIARLAMFDALTGLANRQQMHTALEQMLKQAAKTYRPTSLLLMDLDRFKAVNDTLGHPAGDALLQQVAQRLTRVIGDAGLVGRLGGDEFQVVLSGAGNRDQLAALSREVIAVLSQPYSVVGSTVSIGCSVGIAIAPDDGQDPEVLVRNADLALYAAKADGRSTHRFFRPEMLADAQGRKQLEDDLRIALAQDQLHIAYQPVVSTRDGRIGGYEALLRWDHPKRGPISPAVFVPIAEDCGIIEVLGEWVLRNATLEAATWPENVRVAVNVSPIQFASPALPALVISALANSRIAPERLELEITESVFLNESAASEEMFGKLKAIGVRLALDDFGTGYSSLGYLRSAPFDKIKIDQSFVRGAAVAGSRNAAIIQAIVTLAEALGMETTAEGVELHDEIALIRGLGCSHIQGYVYGRPMPNEAVLQQLAAAGGQGVAAGHKTSRSPRVKMLRSARLDLGDASGEVRIRNISKTGALIDGIRFPDGAEGAPVAIELVDGQMFAATLRWARDGQAGLKFDRPIELDWLNAAPTRTGLRKTA